MSNWKGYELTESQLRYAMENTNSNQAAARWLHVAEPTWKKYAMMYRDEETGLSLFELQKLKWKLNGKSKPVRRHPRNSTHLNNKFKSIPLKEIFENKHVSYSWVKLKSRLIREGWKTEACDVCGYAQRRSGDWEVPLKIQPIDRNWSNYSRDNIAFLCLNCAWQLHVPAGGGRRRKFELNANLEIEWKYAFRDVKPIGEYFEIEDVEDVLVNPVTGSAWDVDRDFR